jgi:hypothetical protein
VLARARRIGLQLGESFDPDPALATSIDAAPELAQNLIRGYLPRIGRETNGWVTSTDTSARTATATSNAPPSRWVGLARILRRTRSIPWR